MDYDEIMKHRALFHGVFKGKRGNEALRKIYDLCGNEKLNCPLNPQTNEINPYSLGWNAAKEDMWKRLRAMLTDELLTEIEVKMRPKVEKPKEPEKKKVHPHKQRKPQ